MIFELSVGGSGPPAIADALNERGLMRRNGRPWAQRQVAAPLGIRELYRTGMLHCGEGERGNGALVLFGGPGAVHVRATLKRGKHMRAMSLLSALVMVCCIGLSALVASAEDPVTVRDLLAKGGSRLTTDELLRLMSDATVAGTQIDRPNTTFENVYKADGTVSGAARIGSDLVGITGKWSVDENGILCQDLWNSRGFSFRLCEVKFVLDGLYFSATTDEPAMRLWRRSIKR
jgi:hypothetical protein